MENGWIDREDLLHRRGALKRLAETYVAGDSKEEIIAVLRVRYGLTTKQAKERLLKLSEDLAGMYFT